MAVRVFFSFSSGLTQSLIVPVGTKAGIVAHVTEVEKTLGIKRSKTPDEGAHWDHWEKNYRAGWPKVEDEVLCKTVEEHNGWVRYIYRMFEEWAAKPVISGETITPEDAAKFWCGLSTLEVRPERWTRSYYTARMEHLYEVMRGRESEGLTFEAKSLTPKQAAAVILIFESYLDKHDCRLDAPKDRDYLASSYDGGYDWCAKCGAVTPEDGDSCSKRKCPLREERAELDAPTTRKPG